MNSRGDASPSTGPTDTERLYQLGYAQEINRSMRRLALSFSIATLPSKLLVSYGKGLEHSGPAILWC